MTGWKANEGIDKSDAQLINAFSVLKDDIIFWFIFIILIIFSLLFCWHFLKTFSKSHAKRNILRFQVIQFIFLYF